MQCGNTESRETYQWIGLQHPVTQLPGRYLAINLE